MNNLYIGLLRLENRAAFFVLAKASQVTPRETAEERFHTLARGWLAYPVTPRTHIYRRRAVVDVNSWSVRKSNNTNANNSYNRSSAVDSSSFNRPQVGKPTWGYDYTTALRRLQRHPPRHISLWSFLGCKLTVDDGRVRMATKQKKRDNTLRVVSPYNSI